MGILSGYFGAEMRPRTVRQAVPIDFLWAAAVPANVMKLLTLTYKYSLVKK